MLKVGSEYLDFNGTVEVERKVKLFEEIDTADGDVSFGFDLPWTSHNIKTLNFPLPDNLTKSVYQRIDCDLQDDNGLSVYTGFIRIEKVIRERSLFISFFSGNSNWFGLISGNLQELDFSQYDVEQTEANIISSWSNTEGLTFPLVDNGGLLTRSYAQVKVEDFVGAFYIHTVFKKIFQSATIKLQGELFEDPTYLKAITIKNSKNQVEIDARSSFVKSDGLVRASLGVYYKIPFDDDSTFPYFDGSTGNFDLANDQYVADVKMRVKIDHYLKAEGYSGAHLEAVQVRVNNVQVDIHSNATSSPSQTDPLIVTGTTNIIVNPGDIIDWYTLQSGTNLVNVIEATVKITPVYVYKTFGTSSLPNWTKQQFVSNIFQLFNIITAYEPKTKTLTCNLFNKIKDKEPIDISEYVTIEEVDYESFISNYGKETTFAYNEVEFDEVKDYNIANFFKYGQGVINVNNGFLPEKASVIDSEFSNPFSYINGVFNMSMERLNLLEFEEGDSLENTSVTDNSGIARFNIPEDLFLVGDLIRIEDSTNPAYNGEWVVSDAATGWVEFLGISYDTDAVATLTKLDYAYNNSDDVFILLNIPLYPIANFSGNEFFYLEATAQTSWGIGYFSLLNTNLQINTDYKQSLSFGAIENPLFYQRTLIQTYWSLFERILNDPVKPICTAVMPLKVYSSIDFLRPVTIKTLETSNLYYVNLISGYKNSYQPASMELIKLP